MLDARKQRLHQEFLELLMRKIAKQNFFTFCIKLHLTLIIPLIFYYSSICSKYCFLVNGKNPPEII